jgi:spore germination cell wall hydrolase CwlJ-like protein
MLGLFRAGGFAAAALMLAAVSAAPAAAADATIPQPISSAAIPVETGMPNATPAPAAQIAPAPAENPVAQRRPLKDLVISFVDYGNRDAEQECLVKAIYFEARSESLEGQLAVAEVILNRAASALYPSTICGVVTQPAQFSFIRAGQFPIPDRSSDGWRRALAIADIARKGLADAVAPNVLWYHATYVAPSWGRRLTRVAQIGTHIFYN